VRHDGPSADRQLSVRPSLRWSFACVVVALCAWVPGCARSIDGTPVASDPAGALPTPPSSSTTTTKSIQNYDISRLHQLQGGFPAGFNQVEATAVTTLGPDAETFFAIGAGDVVAVDPPRCRALLQPVRAPSDAQFIMVGGIGKGAILVGAVNSPEPLEETTLLAGCEKIAVRQRLSGQQLGWTVTHRPGPSIDGVVTTESMAVADREGTKSYVLAAFLSRTVAVAVQGVLPGNPDAEDVFQDLLVKAVNIVRAA
jgi:Domain of unknown function (DUF5642)